MKLKFQSFDFTASQELTDFIKTKEAKLEYFYGEIIWSEVCLNWTNPIPEKIKYVK